jgi:hypothetical protein
LHFPSSNRNLSRGGSAVAPSPPPLVGIISGRATTLNRPVVSPIELSCRLYTCSGCRSLPASSPCRLRA